MTKEDFQWRLTIFHALLIAWYSDSVLSLTRIINEDVIEVFINRSIVASKIQYLVIRVSDSTVTPTSLRLIPTRRHFNPFLLIYSYNNHTGWNSTLYLSCIHRNLYRRCLVDCRKYLYLQGHNLCKFKMATRTYNAHQTQQFSPRYTLQCGSFLEEHSHRFQAATYY